MPVKIKSRRLERFNSNLLLFVSAGFGKPQHSIPYFLQGFLVDFDFVFLAEGVDPVLFEFLLIVAGDGAAHVGCFLRGVDDTTVVGEPCCPFAGCLGTFAVESDIVDNGILTLGSHHALNLDMAAEIVAQTVDERIIFDFG